MGASWRASKRWTLSLVLLIGCARTMEPGVPTQSPDAVLEMARARPIPDPLYAKYSIKVRSEKLNLAGSTNGVLVVDRPGQGHLALLGPLGGPIFTLSSDGAGVSVVLPREERHLVAPEAASVLGEVGAGLVGLDELFGLLTGDVPFDDAKVKSRTRLADDRVQVVMVGPEDTLVTVVLRMADGTPEGLGVHDKGGAPLLEAVFSAFEPLEADPAALLPSAVAVEIPSLELRVELTYRSWKVLDAVPDVFSLDGPEGFRTESLEQALKDLAAGMALQSAAAAPEE